MSTTNDMPKKKKSTKKDIVAPVQEEVVTEEVVEEVSNADQPIEIESFTPMETTESSDVTAAEFSDAVQEGVIDTDPVYQYPIVVEFEKVSFETYVNAFKPIYLSIVKAQSENGSSYGYKEDDMIESARAVYDHILIPTRSSRKAATYNFAFPFPEAELKPGTSITIPTGLKANCKPGWAVIVSVARSLGFKFRVQLDTTIEIYDEEYYNNPNNEGHIVLQLTNDNRDGYTVVLSGGDVIARAMVVPFGISTADEDQQKELDAYIENETLKHLQEEHDQHEHMHDHEHPHTH